MSFIDENPHLFSDKYKPLVPAYIAHADGTMTFPEGPVKGIIRVNRLCPIWRPKVREALRLLQLRKAASGQ